MATMTKMNDEQFDRLLERVLRAPEPSTSLQEKLLAVPDVAEAADRRVPEAANDPLWRRVLPVAACLALFLLLAHRFQPARNAGLEQEILNHVYAERQFLETRSGKIPLAEVNARMERMIGAHIESSPATEALDVHFAKDCWVAKAVTMHLIITVDTGPVSLMMIPQHVVDKTTAIADSRFSGTITPVDGGTLVVLANRQEPVGKYFNIFTDHVKWDY